VQFSGGIIAISNLELHPTPVLDAIRSRVHPLRHNPTDGEMAAQMRYMTQFGWPVTQPKLSPAECTEVTEFVIAESRRMGRHLDFRRLWDQAYGDYLQHRAGHSQTHWRDLVISDLREQSDQHQFTPSTPRQQRKEMEQQIAAQLRREHGGHISEQLRRWEEQTGKSDRAFWRRLREIEGGEDQ